MQPKCVSFLRCSATEGMKTHLEVRVALGWTAKGAIVAVLAGQSQNEMDNKIIMRWEGGKPGVKQSCKVYPPTPEDLVGGKEEKLREKGARIDGSSWPKAWGRRV